MGERTSAEGGRFTLLNLGTVGVVVAWLAFASYAIAYLTAH
jgi:hypothetical protein